MKTIRTVALFLTLMATANAQSSFVNYKLNFVGGTASTNVSIASNVVAKIVNFNSLNATSATLALQYSNSPTIYTYNSPTQVMNYPILGPASVNVTVTGVSSPGAHVLVQYDGVNQTQLPFAAVQSPGVGANVVLQSSTNLTTWANVATNASIGATGYKFFRVQLQ